MGKHLGFMAVEFTGCVSASQSEINATHRHLQNPTYNRATVVFPEITTAFENEPLFWGEAVLYNWYLGPS